MTYIEKMTSVENSEQKQWFVMRDLKRQNAKDPAYKLLNDIGIKVFVPMRWQLTARRGGTIRQQVPVVQDLLFVYDSRAHLDPIVERTQTLQYRWLRNYYRKPMTVSDIEMEKFIFAVENTESPQYYLPNEITPQMIGRKIRIAGGSLIGYEGCLLKSRGSKTKRLLVEMKNCIILSIEVNPVYIQLV